jgi:hypothetical protein
VSNLRSAGYYCLAASGSNLPLESCRVKRPFLALVSLSVLVPALRSGHAQAQNIGYGPLALTLPASTRMLAMGDIGVSGRDDDVIFYNPAQLFIARGTSFSLTRLSETARGGTMSTVLRLGPGAIGFGANYLEYQVTPLSYPFEPGDVIDPNFALGTSAVGALGYAQVYRGIRFGAAAKYAMDAVDIERFGKLYGDFGIARDFRGGRYNTALSVQHVGTALSRGSDRIQAPTTVTLGGATSRQLGPLDGAATVGVSYSEVDEVTAGGGAEISWSWLVGYSIAARAGAHQARQGGDTEFMGGLGFTADRMTLDVAIHRLPGDRAGYRAGIRIR